MNNIIKANKERILLGSAILFSLIILIRWWYYIYAYSVNMMFYDQWDLYEAFIRNNNLWEIFRWQHGPHRQGIGFIITKYVADLSGWNTRVESFVIGLVVCLAAFAALFLRKKLNRRFGFADVAIPLIFLTPLQYQLYAGAPDLSYAAMPLLLLTLYVVAWMALRGTWRYVTVLALNYLLIYTGYGIVTGLVTPFMFLTEFVKACRERDKKAMRVSLVCAAIAVLSLLSFFIGFRFGESMLADSLFAADDWRLYPLYMSLMFANFCGIKGMTVISYAAGFCVISLMIILAVQHGIRSLKEGMTAAESRQSQVIAFLIAFTLIFCASTAIGRISLGLITAQSSRYITLMIPGFFGIYLWLVNMPEGMTRRTLLTMLVVLLMAATFPLREIDSEYLRISRDGKSDWRNYYLLTEDIEMTTLATRFIIHWDPERIHLKEKLEYLKKNKLNFYRDAGVR